MDIESAEMIKLLPGEIVGYAALALLILYIARKMYGETAKDKDKILSKYEARLDQVEASLSAMTQDNHGLTSRLTEAQVELATIRAELTAAQDSEDRCAQRMSRLEARYESRIFELESEISILRVRVGEVSESYIDGGS